MNRAVKAVTGGNPVIVVETEFAPGDVLLGPVTTHPVAGSVGQRLAVGLGVPPAERDVPLDVLLLALLARVLPVAGVAHPAGIRRADVVVLDDELEIPASAFESHQAPGGQQAEDLHEDVVGQEDKVLLGLQELLDLETGLQKVVGSLPL